MDGDASAVAYILRSAKGTSVGVDTRTRDGWTPLLLAARHGHNAVCDALLRAGADVNARNGAADDDTALMHAAAHGHSDVIDTLLAAGGDASFRTRSKGSTALLQSVWAGHTLAVEALLRGGARADASNNAGLTPLVCATLAPEGAAAFHAVLTLGLQQMDVLADADADVDDEHGGGGAAAAASAATAAAAVRVNMSLSSPSSAMASSSRSPSLASLEARRALWRRRFLNAAAADGWTALMHAAQRGDDEQAAALIAAGADGGARNRRGWTALMLAARAGAADVVDTLLHGGSDGDGDGGGSGVGGSYVDVDAQSLAGTTALMHAAWRGDSGVARALLAAGATVSLHDSAGLTALDMAGSDAVRDDIVAAARSAHEVSLRREQVLAVSWRDAAEDLLYVRRLHLAMTAVAKHCRGAWQQMDDDATAVDSAATASAAPSDSQPTSATPAATAATTPNTVAVLTLSTTEAAQRAAEAAYITYKEAAAAVATAATPSPEHLSAASRLRDECVSTCDALLADLAAVAASLRTHRLNAAYEAAAQLLDALRAAGLQYLLRGVLTTVGEFSLLDPDAAAVAAAGSTDPFSATDADGDVKFEVSPPSSSSSSSSASSSSSLSSSDSIPYVRPLNVRSHVYISFTRLLRADAHRQACVVASLEATTFEQFEAARDSVDGATDAVSGDTTMKIASPAAAATATAVSDATVATSTTSATPKSTSYFGSLFAGDENGDDDHDEDYDENKVDDRSDIAAGVKGVVSAASGGSSGTVTSTSTSAVRKASKRSFYDSVELRERRRRVLVEVAPWLMEARSQLRDDLAILKRSVRRVAARIGASRTAAEASTASVAELSDRYRRLAEGLRPPGVTPTPK